MLVPDSQKNKKPGEDKCKASEVKTNSVQRRGRRWSAEYHQFALNLYFHGPRAYRHLSRMLNCKVTKTVVVKYFNDSRNYSNRYCSPRWSYSGLTFTRSCVHLNIWRNVVEGKSAVQCKAWHCEGILRQRCAKNAGRGKFSAPDTCSSHFKNVDSACCLHSIKDKNARRYPSWSNPNINQAAAGSPVVCEGAHLWPGW